MDLGGFLQACGTVGMAVFDPEGHMSSYGLCIRFGSEAEVKAQKCNGLIAGEAMQNMRLGQFLITPGRMKQPPRTRFEELDLGIRHGRTRWCRA